MTCSGLVPDFVEVAPDVFSVSLSFVESKAGIVMGERGALAIDSGLYSDEAEEMIGFIRARGMVPNRLIYTHGHGDHVLGSAPFKGAEIIASDLASDEIHRNLRIWADRMRTPLAELEAQIAFPTLTFSENLHLDLGNKTAVLFPTPGHSPDHVAVYIKEQRVLFAGDCVVTGIVPPINNGDGRVLEATLRSLQNLEIDCLVSGHGDVVYGQEQSQAWIAWLLSYLSEVRNQIRAQLARGTAREEVIEMITFEHFIGTHLPDDRHDMPGRHRTTVECVLREELERIAVPENQKGQRS